MARGGFSQDPEVAARQRAALEAGRKIAAERRKAGLPTKRRESRGVAGDSRQSDNAGSPAKKTRVKPGTYTGGQGGKKPATRQRRDPEAEKPKVGRATRIYGKLLGVDL